MSDIKNIALLELNLLRDLILDDSIKVDFADPLTSYRTQLVDACDKAIVNVANGVETSDEKCNKHIVSNNEVAVLELECFLCDATFDNQKDLDEHYKVKHQN